MGGIETPGRARAVILNLAVWFSVHTLFARVDEVRAFGARLLVPDWGTLDPISLVLAAAAMVAIFRFHLGMVPVLLGSVVAGG